MFARLIQFLRTKMRSKAVLVGTAAVAALGLAGAWALAGSEARHDFMSATLRAPGSTVTGNGSDAGGSAAAGPQRSAGTDPAADAPAADGSRKQLRRSGRPNSTACPPPPGSTVNGGLTVDGQCVITGVTINGGVVITGTGHLTLYRSTVNGGTSVRPGGEFDSNFPVLAGGGNTLNGGLVADNAFDLDIFNSTIQGHVVFSGGPSNVAFFEVCGTHVQGDFTLENLSANGAEIGDVRLDVCPVNTISGSVRIVNDNGSMVELEKVTIGGSVEIFNSKPSLTGNTIGGSLLCHGGASLAKYDPDDTNLNMVHGKNTCA